MTEQHLERLCDFYDNMTAADVMQLSDYYATNAYFKDPFHEIDTLVDIQTIFNHMFRLDPDASFTMFSRFTNGHTAMVTWVLDMTAKKMNLSIRGSTYFEFDAKGLITHHRDYWDTGEELFAKLPVIGHPTRWLLKQFSALKNK